MNMDEYKNDDAENGTDAGKSDAWRDGLITAEELQTKQFKPVRIILAQAAPHGRGRLLQPRSSRSHMDL